MCPFLFLCPKNSQDRYGISFDTILESFWADVERVPQEARLRGFLLALYRIAPAFWDFPGRRLLA